MDWVGDNQAGWRVVLLSIRAPYAESLFAGRKTVELRRLRPNLRQGDLVIVYVPSPVCAVWGGFVVRGVLSAPVEEMWRAVAASAGVHRSAYESYFCGRQVAHAIEVDKLFRWDAPVTLHRLHQILPGYRPPQSYHYLSSQRTQDVVLAREFLQACLCGAEDGLSNSRGHSAA